MTTQVRTRASDVVAAVDVGSNTIKMTVARWDGRSLIEFENDARTVRLSAGLETSGNISPEREEAALTCLAQFAATATSAGASVFIGVATEVLRAATNGQAILARIARETPWRLAVISGEDEAALTYAGVRTALSGVASAVIADVGGGSTELISVTGDQPAAFKSLSIGSGRLTDRLVRSDPPTADELARCRRAVSDQLNDAEFVAPAPLQRLLVTGGTGLYLGTLVGADRFAPAKLDIARQTLLGFPNAILSDFLRIPLERAKVLPAGIAVVESLTDHWEPSEIAVAESGVRRGLLLRYFTAHGPPVS